MKMPFGKYRGQEVCDIEDISYLKWAEENCVNPQLRKELQFEIERREGDRPGMGRVVRKGKP